MMVLCWLSFAIAAACAEDVDWLIHAAGEAFGGGDAISAVAAVSPE